MIPRSGSKNGAIAKIARPYSRPGVDGIVPFGLDNWRRGVVYTVRPELHVPLEPERDYYLSVIVRRRISGKAEADSYLDVYTHARNVSQGRVDSLVCHNGSRPHSWIDSQHWGTMTFGSTSFRFASLTTAVSASEGSAGEKPPDLNALAVPSEISEDALKSKFASEAGNSSRRQRAQEIYNDFDFRDSPSESSGPVIFSYGEYTPEAAIEDYSAYVGRAERLAQFCQNTLAGESAQFRIVAREWMQTSSPTLAVVHVYFAA